MMDFFGFDHELSTWLFSLALFSSFQFPGMAHLRMFRVFVDHRSLSLYTIIARLCNRVVVRRVLSRTMNKLLSLPNMQIGMNYCEFCMEVVFYLPLPIYCFYQSQWLDGSYTNCCTVFYGIYCLAWSKCTGKLRLLSARAIRRPMFPHVLEL